jgi:hypothetical protein
VAMWIFPPWLVKARPSLHGFRVEHEDKSRESKFASHRITES